MEKNIRVGYEIKYNKATGLISKNMMKKVAKDLVALCKKSKRAIVFIKDVNGNTTCWGFARDTYWADIEVDCTFTEGETESGREMCNTLYADWVNGQHREIDWKECTVEHERF